MEGAQYRVPAIPVQASSTVAPRSAAPADYGRLSLRVPAGRVVCLQGGSGDLLWREYADPTTPSDARMAAR